MRDREWQFLLLLRRKRLLLMRGLPAWMVGEFVGTFILVFFGCGSVCAAVKSTVPSTTPSPPRYLQSG